MFSAAEVYRARKNSKYKDRKISLRVWTKCSFERLQKYKLNKKFKKSCEILSINAQGMLKLTNVLLLFIEIALYLQQCLRHYICANVCG
jgi:hypothetical protein